ncbi:MAG: hypothetical protein IKH16_03855, partial [Selenomonadaceae bacterium]|nr:hypothetical protein [Selenomonadaceae bacterium]
MESVWQAAINDSEHAIAYVVPIPYCDRAPDGGASEWHCEIAKFPLYVPTIDYRYIDLEDMHPDVIIIQNPYDNYNIVTSVDETYYSWNLKKWTNKLVYIPYFMIEEFDPDDEEALEDFSCFVFPGRGVMNADLTIVQSENIREAYIRLLLKRTDKDRAYWEKRILGLGSPKIDKVLATKREDILLPEDWRRVIEKPDGTWKTVVLYNARLGNLLKYKDKLLDKMEWVFQTFQERRDEVALLWRPHPLFEATVKARAPELWARYRWMVERYRREGWGIYDDSTDLHRAIAVSDGYYGDGSSIVCLYKATGKPVLLQDVRTDVGCLRFIGASRLSTTLYFFSLNLAGLFSLRLKDLKVGLVDIFPFTHIDEIGIFGEIVEYKNVLYFAPMQEIALWSFDMKEKMWKKYPIEEEVIQGCFLKFRFIYNFGHDIWLIPQEARSIVNFDAEKNEYIYLGSWYQILKDDINRISGYKQLFYIPAVLGDCIWLPCTFVNALICVD